MSETKRLTLPITGMYCANCVTTIERNLNKVSGVQRALVNLASERAQVEFDPQQATLAAMVARVERAGYGVATGLAQILLRRLGDDNDARRLEKALAQLDGALEVHVNLSSETVHVRYVPTILDQVEIRTAIARAGFEAVEISGPGVDAEAQALCQGDKCTASASHHRASLHNTLVPVVDVG